jgi:hypothetical protein
MIKKSIHIYLQSYLATLKELLCQSTHVTTYISNSTPILQATHKNLVKVSAEENKLSSGKMKVSAPPQFGCLLFSHL